MNVTLSLFPNTVASAGDAPTGAQGTLGAGPESLSAQGVVGANPFALLLSGQLRGAAEWSGAQGLGMALANGKLPAALAQRLPQDGKALPEDASAAGSDADNTLLPAVSSLDLAAVLNLQQGDAVGAAQQAGQAGDGDWTLNLLQLALGEPNRGDDPQLPAAKNQTGDDQSILRILQGAGLRADVDRTGSLLQRAIANTPHYGDGNDQPAANHAVTAVTADQGIRAPADLQSKAAPVAQATLQQPLGKQGWDQELGSRMVWMSKQDLQSAQLRLNPAHLGPLEVRLSVQQDHTANVAFLSNHAPVRDAVEAAIPRLREMLADNGFNLTDVDVSSQSHGQARDQNASDSSWLMQADANMDTTAAEEVAREMAIGLVDYFA